MIIRKKFFAKLTAIKKHSFCRCPKMFASVAFTMDTYSHIIEGMQEDAMALLDEVLPPGKNRVQNKINANFVKNEG